MWVTVQVRVGVIGVHLPAQIAHERHQIVVYLHQERYRQHLRTHDRYDKQMDGWMDGWIGRQMETWVDICTDENMGRYPHSEHVSKIHLMLIATCKNQSGN